jgi:WD40 repeat protein
MIKVKVLFLAANPAGTQPLKLDDEILQIIERVQNSECRDSLEFIVRRGVRPEDLSQALLKERPHIVHFSGHGNSVRQPASQSDSVRDLGFEPPRAGSELILQDVQGNRVSVSQEALVHLFETIPDNLRVVVLNACHTRSLAEAIARTVECTIGMNRPIGDEAAIAFAASFYEAIGFRRSVKEAFELGRSLMQMKGIAQHQTPELLTRRGLDAAGFVLIPPIIEATPTDALRKPSVGPADDRGHTPPGRPTPPDGLGQLDLVPDLPPHFLPRQDEVELCCAKLLGSDPETVAITAPHKTALALRGMGGAGKSVLAIAVAQDERIRRRFVDGIFWINVGQENAGTEAKATALQASLAARLGSPLAAVTVQQGRQHLRRLLADRACLVILDDVWDTLDAQRMAVVEKTSSSCMLITTREGSIVTNLNADEVCLGQLPPDQAVALLSDWCGTPVGGNAEASAVARECGYLPLALAICGAQARERVSWTEITSRLRRADLSFLKRRGLDPTYESVLRSIAASVNHLSDTETETARRYRDLAVLPPGEAVSESVVAMLWAETTGCPLDEAGFCLVSLERKSLLSLKGDAPRRSVSLHDLLHDYVKGTHPDLKKASNQLVHAYRGHCPSGWSSGPDDGYFFQHLPYHFREAGLNDELRSLLLDFDWLAAKLRATDVVRLLADFDLVSRDAVVRLVRDALRLSAYHLARDPGLLRSQLHARLLGVDCPEIQQLVERGVGPPPSLRLLTPALTAPGGGLVLTFAGHAKFVNAVAVTPDGTRAVSASGDCTLNVWDLQTGSLLRTLRGHASSVNGVAVTPDGRWAVSASSDETLRVWDLESGSLIRSLEGHTNAVRAVAVTPDGNRAVSASEDWTLKVWDLETGSSLRSLKEHTKGINAVAVTPDGTRAVSASDDWTLKVWDIETGCLIRTLKGRLSNVYAAAITPDGRRAISASADKTLRVWDLESGSLIRSLEGHTNAVHAVAVTPDGKLAVSASNDKTLRVWDLESGSLIRSLEGHAALVGGVAVTPDGTRAVSASLDRTLKVWDLETGSSSRPLARHEGRVNAVAVTPDGTRAVSASLDRTLKVWDLETGSLIRTLEGHTNEVEAVAVTPDGTRAVSASDDKTLKVWDLGSGSLLHSLEGHRDRVTAVALSPDGTRAVSASDDKTLKGWDLESGSLIRSLHGHAGSIKAVALTPDSTRAVSASLDSTLKVWDLESSSLLHSLAGYTSQASAVAVTPDGTRAVSASGDKTLKVWDLGTGSLLHSLEGHIDTVTAVVLTPDGMRAVSASNDRTLKVWDLGPGTLLHSLEGHAAWITAVVLTLDGKRAVSASGDWTLKAWDLETGSILAKYASDNIIRCCAFSASCRTIVAGDLGGRMHFLRFDERSSGPG